MARLTTTDAAHQRGITRATLSTLIAQGTVSPTPDALIAQAARVRVAPSIDTLHARTRTPRDRHARLQTSPDTLGDILRAQLRLRQKREREQARLYAERAQAYRDHSAPCTTMVHEAQQQHQRLLDRPRSAPPPAPSPESQPVILRPTQPLEDPRGAMRRRMVARLREHPAGLTPAELRTTLLGVDRPRGDTCLGLLRSGLRQRVRRGR